MTFQTVADATLAASVLPVVAGALMRSRRRLPWLWFMLALGAAANVASFLMARAGYHNLGLSYLYPPVEIVLVLALLRHWPVFTSCRLLFSAAQGLVIVGAVVALMAAAGPKIVTTFEAVLYPLWAFAVVGLSTVGLVNGVRRRTDRLVAVALVLYYAPIALFYPWLNVVMVPTFAILFQAILLAHIIAYVVFTAAFVRARRST